MNLTFKQENFCLAYVKHGNASEAYRQSYIAGQMKETSINRKAKELMDNGKIAARIADLRKPVIEAAQFTLENHLKTLAKLRDGAVASNQFSAAITAEVNRGKASGFYAEKAQLGRDQKNPLALLMHLVSGTSLPVVQDVDIEDDDEL